MNGVAVSTESDWPVYSLKLKGRSEVAERTLEFRFEKPPGLTFKAGQFMDLTLINPPESDAEGNTRGFSINNAPDDPDLMFTTRLRDTAFTRVLQRIPLGTEMRVEGPFGNFTLHNDTSRPAILMAGGIGITPFRSMVRRAAHENLPHRIVLFYANRRPEDAPFLGELRAFAQQNPNFTFVPTMTQMESSNLHWQGETGHLDNAMILRHLKPRNTTANNPVRPIYYIAGPPRMVAAVHTMLNVAGIDDDEVRIEDFTGY